MLTAALLAFALSSGSGQVAVIAATPDPAEVRRGDNATEAETRQVCRFETVTGSNRRTRVCRDVPRHDVQDQATREYMRDAQRVRVPDGN